MGGGRKTQMITFSDYPISGASSSYNPNAIAKLMGKANLAGVIFGCTNNTMSECLTKQIFGLPRPHINYIRNIEPGLPLFLFNYSTRMLHGVYESASSGQMNINPHAWTENGIERTAYPAQVRIQNKTYCQPIPENQFRQIIAENYYTSSHFYFELDQKQVKGLLSLFVATPGFENVGVPPKRNIMKPFPANKSNSKPNTDILHSKSQWKSKEPKSWADLFAKNTSQTYCNVDNNSTEEDENKEIVCDSDIDISEFVSDWEDLCLDDSQSNSEKLEHESSCNDLLVEKEKMLDQIDKIGATSKVEKMECSSANKTVTNEEEKGRLDEKKNLHLENAELMQCLTELKEEMILMKAKQIETQSEVDLLRRIVKDMKKECQCVKDLESKVGPVIAHTEETPNDSSIEDYLRCEKFLYLIGGNNGERWLDSLDSYSPKLDILTPLKKMCCPRSYAAATIFNDGFCVFGGRYGDSNLWHKSVEFYNPTSNELIPYPSLVQENGNLAGATLNGKIFAIGGGNGKQYFSNVEMFDPLFGKWMCSQSMLQKRFALAASELNGVLYAVGGFDGNNCLSSVEMYDPRESSWTQLPNMNTRRSCHSLAVINEKLYVLGGHDGNQMVSSTEVFDPRAGSWLPSNPLNSMRGYAAAVEFNGSLFVIGGVKDSKNIADTVEYYQEDVGWIAADLKAIGRRTFFSAIVM